MYIVVVIVVVVIAFSNPLSSDTTRPIKTKLGMNVSWGILHRKNVGIFDLSKKWPPLLKIEHRGHTVVFRICIQNRQVEPNSD